MPLDQAVERIDGIDGEGALGTALDGAIPLPSATARLADADARPEEVIGRADELVVVQGEGDRNLALERRRQDGGRQLMIDAVHMDDVGAEIVEQRGELPFGLARMEEARGGR